MQVQRLTKDDFHVNGEPKLEDDEKIHYKQSKVHLFIGEDSKHSEGLGNLFVTTKKVIWVQDLEQGMQVSTENGHDASSVGYAYDFHIIMCHAIAKANSFEYFAQVCEQITQSYSEQGSIYCQLDTTDDECSSIRFVPEDDSTLKTLFEAFSTCAELNPDPIDEDEGNFFYNQEEVLNGLDLNNMTSEQQDKLAHLESMLPDLVVPGQFDDAEAEEPEQSSKRARTDNDDSVTPQ